MDKMLIELPDEVAAFVNEAVRNGGFASPSDFVQKLIAREQRRAEIDQKLQEAVDQCERGEYKEWKRGDAMKLFDEVMRDRRAEKGA